ncbi:MAG: ATP-dependent zinc protease [Sphingobacteriales bacterium]|nr:MAG: ATP-dependent zinc protease [Sphingobacteriales bacterium]
MEKKKRRKLSIGRRELVDFPDLELLEIEAKIDTGAFTSALHCSNIQETEIDGLPAISVEFLDPTHQSYNHKQLIFRRFEIRDIRSSFGDVQERYVIKTRIRLFNRDIEAEFSLSDRSDMRYPVLIGRSLLRGNFVVDVSKKNISLRTKNKAT